MNWINVRGFLECVGRLLLGFTFITAGVLKLVSPADFSYTLTALNIVPLFMVRGIVSGLPPYEIMCGLLLVVGFEIRTGLIAIICMLSAFTLVIIHSMSQSVPIDCGCFGELLWPGAGAWTDLTRDLLLLGIAIGLYSVPHEKLKLWRSDAAIV